MYRYGLMRVHEERNQIESYNLSTELNISMDYIDGKDKSRRLQQKSDYSRKIHESNQSDESARKPGQQTQSTDLKAIINFPFYSYTSGTNEISNTNSNPPAVSRGNQPVASQSFSPIRQNRLGALDLSSSTGGECYTTDVGGTALSTFKKDYRVGR